MLLLDHVLIVAHLLEVLAGNSTILLDVISVEEHNMVVLGSLVDLATSAALLLIEAAFLRESVDPVAPAGRSLDHIIGEGTRIVETIWLL